MKSLKDLMARDNEPSNKEPMKDAHADAKMAILEQLRDLAHELMNDKYGDKMKGMREVSVQAPDKAGLAKGLDLAKGIVDDPDHMSEEEHDESPEDQADEDANHEDEQEIEDEEDPRKRY